MWNPHRDESRLIRRLDRKLEAVKAPSSPPELEPRLHLGPQAFHSIQSFLLDLLNYKNGHILLELKTVDQRKSTDFLQRWRVLWAQYRKGGSVELRFQLEVIERLAGLPSVKLFEAGLREHRKQRELISPGVQRSRSRQP